VYSLPSSSALSLPTSFDTLRYSLRCASSAGVGSARGIGYDLLSSLVSGLVAVVILSRREVLQVQYNVNKPSLNEF
jgi:hypothetical protein